MMDFEKLIGAPHTRGAAASGPIMDFEKLIGISYTRGAAA